MHRPFLLRVFLLLLAIGCNLRDTRANLGAPPVPKAGNIAGDSYFTQMSVLQEELTINMADINTGKPVKVRAKYVIDCPQLLRNIQLVFVANALTESRYRVELDNTLINGYLSTFDTIPGHWLPPDSIPGYGEKIPYLYSRNGLISFRFDSLPAGQHILIVDYDADASQWYENEDLSVTNTFVYILKPTDKWKRFANFHLVAFYPAGWEFSSNLQLERAGSNSLHGDWKALPGDYLTLAVRKPASTPEHLSFLFVGISWVAFLSLSLFWMAKVAKFRLKRNRYRLLQAVDTLLLATIATIFFFYIYFTRFDLLKILLEGQMSPRVTYGTGYFVIAFPFVWILAIVFAFILDGLITRYLRKKYFNNTPL